MATTRPGDFSSFIGQRSVCRNLGVAIRAAQVRGDSLDHTLFSGPAGLGKTTLANIIVTAMGGELTITSGAVLRAPRDVIGSLVRLAEGDCLFIDEIHRVPMTVEEYLYTAMEDNAIDTVSDAGHAIRLDLANFTLIGATTREGMLSEPLLARFGLAFRLEPYQSEDLAIIIIRAAKKQQIPITYNAAMFLAERSRGTPRIALRVLRRARDYAQVHYTGNIILSIAREAMCELGIGKYGLTDTDRKILKALEVNSKPVGLSTLAEIAHESRDTLENVLEPYMIRCGLLLRTSKGRVITDKGREVLLRHED